MCGVRYSLNAGIGEERERFWYDLERIVDRVLGGLNGWIGNRMIAGITGAFGVPKDNDNGGRVV